MVAAVAAACFAPARVGAQTAAPALSPSPPPGAVATPPVDAPAPAAAVAVLPPDVQVVRFQGPEGVRVEVLGPNPEPVPTGDGRGLATVGLRVGVPYRLRLSNLPERPGVELFPVVEVVGHLHRPPGIDPGKYPVRVVFSQDDFVEVADRGRLLTQVVYLEDPEQALPISLPKDEIPVVSLSPSEDPLKVATALGRAMVIVRLGGRLPTAVEAGGPDFGPGIAGLGGPCPFTGPDGGRCPVACGPVCGTPPPPGRPWVPKDEFLCDGGDHGQPAHFGGDGGLAGIDPRDAIIRFDDGRRPRALPTNTVCIYAPRFAEVRASVGPSASDVVTSTSGYRTLAKETSEAGRVGPGRLVKNQGAELARNRARASGTEGKAHAGVHSDLRVVSGYDNTVGVARNLKLQTAETSRARVKAAGMRDRAKSVGIKTAESAVITGIVEGAGEAVMAWVPRETVGVETPPKSPGLAVVKRVSAGEAEAGDTVTFVIEYRNMGNTPIGSVTVVDSLLPRLGYVKGSAHGPKGTVFSADENRVGSTELRWQLPAAIPPGGSGYVSFQAVVR
jgi:uncharacterized repeat protein (TIGR01451 family)